jgi:NAD(P)-dependent dehydrogenase (short-subunit alcohol dehydrogenase family)
VRAQLPTKLPTKVPNYKTNAQPIGRLVEPKEVGRVALFLATGAFITDIVLPVEEAVTMSY